ncbi:hypothetical protein SCP_0205280 [Sparassis crispa]|uniref:DUF7923 domain-containing protein n=1 Tax=Sparassis crispa TaxID=139825 RepID=A0A401GAX9_9APHY|nr:hypothetical protein SCP_0205280 [Sparassis crispa]GBE79330.1 hypothetical protein SCP_0205280 [Sparassis crispa]
MAAPSAGDVNKQLWDEALTRLLDLSTATVKRNGELETRVTELELELSVWKQAHSTVVDLADRDRKAHNAQLATLNRQISSLGILNNLDPLILCVLDGNANIFSQSLLAQGQQGGRQAAQELTKKIAEYLSQEEVQVFGRLSFWVTIYFNKRRLLNLVLGEALCTADQLEGFLSGLSQASPRFLLVDIGQGKDDVDVKIKEYLETCSRLPQTLRVFFGGSQDDSYISTFKALESEELTGKLVIFQVGTQTAEEVQQFAVPSMQVDGLFMIREALQWQRRPGPIPLTGLSSTVTTNGGLISPQSETQSSTTAPMRTACRPIDPTKASR